MKKIFHLAMITIIIGALFISCDMNTGADDKAGEALYKAGTYTATAKGKYDGLKLKVTFSSSKITNIEIVEHKESITDGSYSKVDAVRDAIRDLPNDIVESQSTEVDKVVGATMTTNGIKTAVDDAIAQAKAAL